MKIREGLCFDDVLLVPCYSEVDSRSNIDVSVSIKDFKFGIPLIPANMKTITELDMIQAMYQFKGLSILHRFIHLSEQLTILEYLKTQTNNDILNYLGFSVGVKEEDKKNLEEIVAAGVRIVCIDIAHGHSKLCLDMVKHIKATYKDILIIAGNVATKQAARALWAQGADICKVGIGPGSLCTTRIETGNGVPQLTALMDIDEVKKDYFELNSKYIISDGGAKNSGDLVKALCFADMVMAGNLFAGTNETPSELISIDGKQYKRYDGSSTHKTNHIEGVTALVPSKGPVSTVVTKLIEGIKSGASYQGAVSIKGLQNGCEFIKMTSAGLHESHPHDVHILK